VLQVSLDLEDLHVNTGQVMVEEVQRLQVRGA
jgi:hypothetical protein